MIATIAEKKVQRSQRSYSVSYGNHSPAIAATTIAEIDFSSISAIVAIIWKPLSSDRSDNNRMHCVPDSKIPKFPLLEDLSNSKSMGSLSFPSSFTLRNTHKYKKTTFKQESMIHSRHVEFDKWRERCVRRRSLDLHSLSQRS